MNARADIVPGSYRLAPHVHACRRDSHIILLDLHSDRYIGITEHPASAIGQIVQRWPGCVSGARADVDSEKLDSADGELLSRLTRDGIVVQGADAGSVSPYLPDPQEELVEGYRDRPHKVSHSHLATFVVSTLLTRRRIRRRTLLRITSDFRERRARGDQGRFDVDRARHYVEVFNRLRPLTLTARDTCLLHSLAMGDFLARYGVLPNWVFAVRTGPFAAHCWLQQDRYVFNDVPENVAAYTPILVL